MYESKKRDASIDLFAVSNRLLLVVAPPALVSDRATRLRQRDYLMPC